MPKVYGIFRPGRVAAPPSPVPSRKPEGRRGGRSGAATPPLPTGERAGVRGLSDSGWSRSCAVEKCSIMCPFLFEPQRSSRRPLLCPVMPGLVPLLSGLEFRRGFGPWRDTVSVPRCHPGLVPGSRLAPDLVPGFAPDAARGGPSGAAPYAAPLWTPEQVRGDIGGTRTRAGRAAIRVPGDGPVTRFYQRPAPGPAHLNRTAVEQVRP